MRRILRDFKCNKCSYIQDDFAEIDDTIICNNCGSKMKHIYLSAPNSNNLGKEGSDKSIKALQHSFRKRFIKKELDDVRNKHGEIFDQSLVSSAVKRIKND